MRLSERDEDCDCPSPFFQGAERLPDDRAGGSLRIQNLLGVSPCRAGRQQVAGSNGSDVRIHVTRDPSAECDGRAVAAVCSKNPGRFG